MVKGEEPQSAGQRLRLSFINILAVIVQLPLTKVPELIWRGFCPNRNTGVVFCVIALVLVWGYHFKKFQQKISIILLTTSTEPAR